MKKQNKNYYRDMNIELWLAKQLSSDSMKMLIKHKTGVIIK